MPTIAARIKVLLYMKHPIDTIWRKDFEERLGAWDAPIRKLLLALLDSNDWERDKWNASKYKIDRRFFCRTKRESLDEKLWWTFWHQCTRYPESLAVIPYLSEMLPNIAPCNQPFLIDYLINIALGDPIWHLDYGFHPASTRGAYMGETLGIELHAAVQEFAVPSLMELAHTSPHPRTRAAALLALGWFPALREKTFPLLRQAAQDNTADFIHDGAKFALRMLEKAANQPPGARLGDPDEKLEMEYNDLLTRIRI
jgi:hypothetical protein